MGTENELQELKEAINRGWVSVYGGEPATTQLALVARVGSLADDVKCWQFNARVLQKEFNELEAKSKERDRDLRIALATVLGEYPPGDERYITALSAAQKHFPNEDWGQ